MPRGFSLTLFPCGCWEKPCRWRKQSNRVNTTPPPTPRPRTRATFGALGTWARVLGHRPPAVSLNSASSPRVHLEDLTTVNPAKFKVRKFECPKHAREASWATRTASPRAAGQCMQRWHCWRPRWPVFMSFCVAAPARSESFCVQRRRSESACLRPEHRLMAMRMHRCAPEQCACVP